MIVQLIGFAGLSVKEGILAVIRVIFSAFVRESSVGARPGTPVIRICLAKSAKTERRPPTNTPKAYSEAINLQGYY